MNRRAFLESLVAAGVGTGVAFPVWSQSTATPRLLVLIELRGGCDGLNTVVPVDDGRYHDLRPRLGLKPDAVLRWNRAPALHPSLAPLESLWNDGEMAIVQGVGYPTPNLSHFRSIDIWDTASDSQQVLQQGWLTRAVHQRSGFAALSADGVVIGAADLGPLAGGARAIAISDPQRFVRQSKLASSEHGAARGALKHVLKVEGDIVRAGSGLTGDVVFQTEFPRGAFGLGVRNACAIGAGAAVPIIRLTLSGFDTHQNQAPVQANLLRQLAEAVVSLRSGLREHGRWQQTLVVTYSEFGRRARENQSGGTDHGTASVLFAFGPGVRGGVHGEAPSLASLDDGNLRHTVDFRRVYAGVLEHWWQIPSETVLPRRFEPLGFIRT